MLQGITEGPSGWTLVRSDRGLSNSEEQPDLAKSFASTKEHPAPELLDVDGLEEVFEELSDWDTQLRDINFDDLEPGL